MSDVRNRHGIIGPGEPTKPKEEPPHPHIAVDTVPGGESSPVIPEKVKERTKKHILAHYHGKGAFPSIDWIAGKINQPKTKTREILKALYSEEFLSKKGNRYTLKSSGEGVVTSSGLDKVKAHVKLNPSILFIKVIMFLIGCGATYMSIFHSRWFLAEYYISFRAVMSGVIMIVFNTLCAEMIVLFHAKRQKVLRNSFIVLWVLGVLFSMGSTIIGMYNSQRIDILAQTTSQNAEVKENHNISLKFDLLVEAKNQALADLESEREKRDGFVELINSYTQEQIEADQETFNKQNGRRYTADVRVSAAQEVYTEAVAALEAYLNTEEIEQEVVISRPPDAYSWIAGVLPGEVRPEMLQFWMSTYPAVFYDIIAPVSLSIVFFLPWDMKKVPRKPKKKKRKSKK